jgi:hypothetical protein
MVPWHYTGGVSGPGAPGSGTLAVFAGVPHCWHHLSVSLLENLW